MSTPTPVYDCAIYVRVSTTKAEQADSPENQVQVCRELARRRAADSKEIWNTPDRLIYEDRGTGTDMYHRSAVQKLLHDAEEGKFQIVLFKGISRFARDTEDALHMLRRLVATKARVVSYAENYDSKNGNEFIFTIHAGLAQQGSEKISIDVLLGNKARASNGKWNGKVPDGYLIDQETKKLIINPERSHVIRYIFDLFTTEYIGMTRITQKLNREGFRTSSGRLFQRKGVYEILTNQTYVGDVIYGRRKQEIYYDENNRRRKRTVIDSEQANLVTTKNAHPAIISQEQFDKAQSIIRDNRTGGRGRKDWIYLLSGIIVCDKCGLHYNGKVNHVGTRYYRCNSKVSRGSEGCTSKGLRALDLEEAIIERLRHEVSQANFEDISLPTIDLSQDVSHLRRDLKKANDEINEMTNSALSLLMKNSRKEISDDMFALMNRQIETQIKEQEALRNTIQDKLDQLGQIEIGNKKLHEAITQLLSIDIHAEKNRNIGKMIIKELVRNIHVQDDGEIHVEFNFTRK